MPLPNPFRRSADRPSLKGRAADLRASLSQTPSPSASLPAPGSEEDTIRSHAIVNGYPDLKRAPLEWWTAESLGKAMEAGEITPAECARLYPHATERELRLAEIQHELNLGALHALAHASSYPLPLAIPDDGARVVHTVLHEVASLASEREVAAEPPAADLIASAGIDLRTMRLQDLISLHSAATLLGGTADAITCQPRNKAGRDLNSAGLVVEYLADALDDVISASEAEIRSRKPSDRHESTLRLAALAESTIHNDDPAETAAFARDLLAAVEP